MKKNIYSSMKIFITISFSLLSLTCCKKDDQTITNVTDIDGNTYSVITIGTQLWTAENLKTTTLNDGSKISLITDDNIWATAQSAAYSWKSNDPTLKDSLGAYYNYNAVATNKLCPVGWHVPSDQDWTTLQNYLIEKGYNYDGSTTGNKIAKSLASTSGWYPASNEGAPGNSDFPSVRNRTGFNAIQAGKRDEFGYFSFFNAFWWTSDTKVIGEITFYYCRKISSNGVYLDKSDNYKECGLSVRCIKD